MFNVRLNRLAILSALTVLWLVVACVAPPAAQAPQGGDAAATVAPAADKITIKLAANPWSASALNVNVAKILLEKIGYSVEITDIDENAQWAALASGDLHASLEVWPSGHQKNITDYIDTKQVENGGPLGPVGKIGWYIPTYMVEAHPELATWEGFKKPENAKLFATAETGDSGQFLAGDPGWVQYDTDIIKNLGLALKVVQSGSETAVLSAVDAAYSRKAPILFYFWTPHSVHAKYQLTEVKLPEYTPECYAKATEGGVACDYPADVLFKIFWPALKDKAPEAYQLLKNMNYTTKDQIDMMAAVDLKKQTTEEAAQAWVEANEKVWSAWMPK
ncbi:MAG: ABC transporter substrate-binding protein [Chloroflexi bacterium]|nr:ABC transporter substrate-binding protein [Chloroflexota bacterium]